MSEMSEKKRKRHIRNADLGREYARGWGVESDSVEDVLKAMPPDRTVAALLAALVDRAEGFLAGIAESIEHAADRKRLSRQEALDKRDREEAAPYPGIKEGDSLWKWFDEESVTGGSRAFRYLVVFADSEGRVLLAECDDCRYRPFWADDGYFRTPEEALLAWAKNEDEAFGGSVDRAREILARKEQA